MEVVIDNSSESMRNGDINTAISHVFFSDAELERVLQYDEARQGDNEKIIRTRANNHCDIYPIRLKNAVESGNIEITELEVESYQTQDIFYLSNSCMLRATEKFGFKNLCITNAALYNYTIPCDSDNISEHVNDAAKFIKNHAHTLDQCKFHFKKVNMSDFSKIHKELENWIINTPLNISLTAAKDEFNRQCKSLPEYNDIQTKIRYIASCLDYSKRFSDTKKTIDERTQEYQNIVENNPEFIKNFGKYEALKVTKTAMGDNMYNTFLRCYTYNSTIVKVLSECCYNYTKQREDGRGKKEYLPYDAKELIVKHIGGIAALTKIDDSLKNNNSTTDQQAEAINDFDLTTGGTITDSDCSSSLFNC